MAASYFKAVWQLVKIDNYY